MNSGQRNNKSTNLSREDIHTYNNTKDEQIKNSIEKKALDNEFDQDALDGWSDIKMPSATMKNIDRRFNSRFSVLSISIGAISLSLLAISVFYLFTKESELTTQQQNTQEKLASVERTDIILPQTIEVMKELPIKEQIQVKTIQNDFQAQKEQSTSKNDSQNSLPVAVLPIKEIEKPKLPDQLVKESISGKEIYLSDLKTLDYRIYRSKPVIKTKQLELTGTPANQSEPGKINEDEYTWKNVDIPYIEYIDKTMEIFSKGNNKKALARFQLILETYPDDVNANFYAGLCYYNLKEFTSAVSAFNQCIDSKYTNFNEEAEWYAAKSLLADGKKSEASSLFQEIITANGYYAAQAGKLLKGL